MKFLIHLLGITLAASQSISLVSQLQKQSSSSSISEKPSNCLSVGKENKCEECQQDFLLENGKCIQVNPLSYDVNQLRQSFVPCNGKESCGEAINFNNQKQFTQFIQRHTKQQISNQPSKKQAFPRTIQTFQTAQFRAAPSGSSDSINKFSKSFTPQPAADRDFSGTNNQVEGVDEADLLKTDGTYIYTISNKVLSIILAYPPKKANVVSKITIKDLNPTALFIEEDYLSVFGTDYSQSFPYTSIKIYDISNRGKPYLVRTFRVAGSYQNGRKTQNGFVYLITNQSLYSRVRPWYDFGFGTTLIPHNFIYRYPITYLRPQLTNIITFNLKNPTSSDRKIISICGESSSIMYMSERNIYLTSSTYENGLDYTNIRKIFVWGKRIVPFADGKIRGSLNNQFSLDEYGPYLRVASTLNSRGVSSNSVYSLDYFLRAYGSLDNIAPGQRIFSARYVDKRLYLVTFRQVDPFFVISFSNHKKPSILGHLKVPGFSRYLHPYDEETVIGLGRETDSTGRQLGLKISLFDVSDCSSPKQLAKLQITQKYAQSNAEWEHKAFLFSPQKSLLVIPATMNDKDVKFNGALAIHINKGKKQLTLKSGINHCGENDNFYDRNVERSLYIQNFLYTKSKCLLKINNIDGQFTDVKEIKVPCQQEDPILYKPRKLPILRRPVSIDPIIISDPIEPSPRGVDLNRQQMP